MSWKTTLAGIIALGLQIASIWAPGALGSQKVQSTIQMAAIASGLFVAKDAAATTDSSAVVPPASGEPPKTKAAGA